MMKKMLLLLSLLILSINCASGLNLTYYPAVVASTNVSNVSSFEECVCKCLSSSDCTYFAYWLAISTCQIYSSSESKPSILNFTLPDNDSYTGLYGIPSSYINCKLSVLSSSINYTHNASVYFTFPGNRIISVVVMLIGNQTRLVAIDYNNCTYYIFDINMTQLFNSGTFSPSGFTPMCAVQFSNLLYIGCLSLQIQVRQFSLIGNNTKETPQLLANYSTVGSDVAQSLAVLSSDIIYFVGGSGNVYVLLTQLDKCILLTTLSGYSFPSPLVTLVLDPINMELFLSSNTGYLFRLVLSSINTNNATSIISSGSIDQYQMSFNGITSVFIDKCNRLWVLSSTTPTPQLFLFDQGNKPFSKMNIINLTSSIPTFIYSPVNFQFSDNYTWFTANAENGLYAFFRI